MNDKSFPMYIFGLMMIALFLTACGTPSEAIVPTAIFTPELSTATPTLKPTNASVAIETPVATSTPESLLSVIKTEDIVYARRTKPKEYEWKLDEYTPSEHGAWPIVIFIYGSTDKKSSYQDLGQALAEQGMTVFIISYPGIRPLIAIEGNARGYREMTETVACAIRYAHARALEFGSDTPPITIVGFSLGGGNASYISLVEDKLERRWEAYAASKGGQSSSRVDCKANESVQVDALVGIDGIYDAFIGFGGDTFAEDWFKAKDYDLWEMFHSAIGENPDLKIRLLHGESNFCVAYETSAAFETILAEAGYDVELIQFSGHHQVPLELTVQTVKDVIRE